MSRDERSPYKTVAVAGLGLMGGSLAMALRRSGYQGRILGVSSPATLEEARRLQVIDEGFGYADLPRVGECADLMILAGPISAILEHLGILGASGDRLRRGLVVTDVGSTKRAVLAAARSLPPHVQFIGGHPLAGSEQRGIAAADPFLFQNAYYVLTPAPEVSKAAVEDLARFLGSTGARMVVLPAEDHDRIAATISHLPQILAVSLVDFLDDLGANREHGIHLAAGGFRDMTRIASSPHAVWRDILATNKDVISDVARRFLESMAGAIEELGGRGIEERFEKAARTRAEIPRDSKGFMGRLWDVLVVVEDRPGAIFRSAAPLAEKQINIKDIEILKVREGEGGTLRLAFESEVQAREAIDLLAKHGHSARLRE
jgi:prephenate dehydrogenase